MKNDFNGFPVKFARIRQSHKTPRQQSRIGSRSVEESS